MRSSLPKLPTVQKWRAYEECLEGAGVPIDPALIHECEFDIFQGRAAMSRMITLHDRPTAVFCANDIQAIGAITVCRDAILRVPDDMFLTLSRTYLWHGEITPLPHLRCDNGYVTNKPGMNRCTEHKEVWQRLLIWQARFGLPTTTCWSGLTGTLRV